MDVAYNQHSDRARRKNRSSTSLQHLSLAPLTVKLPLNDDDLIPDAVSAAQPSSYIQGKSAPTTPRLLSRSPSTPRSHSHHRMSSAPSGPLAKSKSVSHLGAARKLHSGRATPGRRNHKDDPLSLGLRHHNDSDWLLRTGALMSYEARESKGQAWLVSRQSSTSLTGMHNHDDDAFEGELAREREIIAASRHHSRRGSNVPSDEDASPYASRFPSRIHSRVHSRSHSLSRPRSQFITPLERPGTSDGFDAGADDSYFPNQDLPGPDFVNLDERLEELELERDSDQDDEATVQRLVRRGQARAGTWFGNVWSLFAVDENEEESDSEDGSSPTDGSSNLSRSRSLSSRNLAGISTVPQERIPPPGADDGSWRDAAWLLSVASKVMF